MSSWIVRYRANVRGFARRKQSITIALAAVAAIGIQILSLSGGAAADAIVLKGTDPMQVVKHGVNDVIAVFNDRQISLDLRREKLRRLAAEYFDFESMSRSVMGYHWRELSPGQRAEFVPLFTSFIEDAYLTKLQDYSVQTVQKELPTVKIQFARETFDGVEYAEVYSNVQLQEQKDPIQVNYLMHLTANQWRVYDLTVDSISVIANYRNQFNRVLNDGGYDKLAADLRAKQSQLQRQLEKAPTPPRAEQ